MNCGGISYCGIVEIVKFNPIIARSTPGEWLLIRLNIKCIAGDVQDVGPLQKCPYIRMS